MKLFVKASLGEKEYWAKLTAEVNYHLSIASIITFMFTACGRFFTLSLLLISL